MLIQLESETDESANVKSIEIKLAYAPIWSIYGHRELEIHISLRSSATFNDLTNKLGIYT